MNEPTTSPNPAGDEPERTAPEGVAAPPEGASTPTEGVAAPAPDGAAPATGESQPGERPRPRTGPIVWGALILAFCVYIAQRTVSPGAVDTAAWVVATVIGLGLLLLGVAVAVLVRGGRR